MYASTALMGEPPPRPTSGRKPGAECCPTASGAEHGVGLQAVRGANGSGAGPPRPWTGPAVTPFARATWLLPGSARLPG